MELGKIGIVLQRFRNRQYEMKKIMVLVAGILAVAALIVAAVFLVNSILESPNVYSGVYIDGYSVGGMSPSELHDWLEEKYRKLPDETELIFFTESYEQRLSYRELGASVNIQGMEEKAFKAGREGSFIKRLAEIMRLGRHPLNISPEFAIDGGKLDTVIEGLSRQFKKDAVVPKVVISDDGAVLCTGESGQEVDSGLLKSRILQAVQRMETAYIYIPVRETDPPRIDVDTVYDAIVREPENAEIIKAEDGSAVVKPHVTGRTIDKAELAGIISRVESREHKVYEEIKLPVEITEPETTTEELEALLFRDVLATASTSFKTNTKNNISRGINIRLAARAIDGTVLFPGEEFSFNDVVGPRTPQKGYVIAHVYSEGRITNGYGGGICQVSTTLYNAALLANLQITERHNHMFTVSYVPLGMDAAVSYGYADLKFKNNTNYPIRIDASVSDSNVLTFRIVGTNLYPDVKVKLISRVVSVTRATTQYIDDPNLPAGTEVVVDKGMDGAVVDTYVQVYNGKDLLKDYKIHQSVYRMLPRKVRRGVRRLAQDTGQETE